MSTGLSGQVNTRPRPLQASTNIIHTKIARNNTNNLKLSVNQNKQNLIEPTKKRTNINQKSKQSDLKKAQTALSTAKPTPAKQTDENDVGAFTKDPYNPLNEYHHFDEELYQKVLKLELADDGLPKFESDEPFDF